MLVGADDFDIRVAKSMTFLSYFQRFQCFHLHQPHLVDQDTIAVGQSIRQQDVDCPEMCHEHLPTKGTSTFKSVGDDVLKDLWFQGIRGFWKGVTASYWGISETVIHFVIYEFLKKQVEKSVCSLGLSIHAQSVYPGDRVSEQTSWRRKECGRLFRIHVLRSLFQDSCHHGCLSPWWVTVKLPSCVWCCIHRLLLAEVARTRMREEGTRYRSFWQTLALVAKEEGRAGLYRGLVTQLIRQIPNTAVMMFTYELTVYGLTKAFRQRASSLDETSSQQSHSQ